MYLKKLITGLLLMGTLGSYAQTVKLTFVKGEKYEITSKATVSSSASVMGQDMESNTAITTVQVIEVKDIRTNETDLVLTTTKLLTNVQSMGQDMSYDSEKKDNTGPLAEAMEKMLGKVKNMTIDASGKIIKEDKDETENPMGSMLPEVAILKQALLGKEFKPGASWQDSVTDNTGKLKVTTVGTYTVNAVNKETHTAMISFAGIQNSSGTMEQMGQEMSITSSNKVESQFEVDMNTGILSQNSSSSTGSSNIDIASMTIPATSKSSTVTKIKRL